MSRAIAIIATSTTSDLFIVLPLPFDLLYAFITVRWSARINVTRDSTAEWVAHQISEAFPSDEAPRYLVCDWDCICGDLFKRRLRAMGFRDKPINKDTPISRAPFSSQAILGGPHHHYARI
jgi:hypothetical protein